MHCPRDTSLTRSSPWLFTSQNFTLGCYSTPTTKHPNFQRQSKFFILSKVCNSNVCMMRTFCSFLSWFQYASKLGSHNLTGLELVLTRQNLKWLNCETIK